MGSGAPVAARHQRFAVCWRWRSPGPEAGLRHRGGAERKAVPGRRRGWARLVWAGRPGGRHRPTRSAAAKIGPRRLDLPTPAREKVVLDTASAAATQARGLNPTRTSPRFVAGRSGDQIEANKGGAVRPVLRLEAAGPPANVSERAHPTLGQVRPVTRRHHR